MILRTATISLNIYSIERSLFVVSLELQFEVIFRYILWLQWWEVLNAIMVYVWKLFRSLCLSTANSPTRVMGVCPLSCTCFLFYTTPSFIDSVLLPCLMRREKTAIRVNTELSRNVVPERRNNYRGRWISKYSYALAPIPLTFQSGILSVISIIFLNTIVISILTTHTLERSRDTLQSPYCSICIPYNAIILNVDEKC
jgi:hypothetical protein